MGGLVYLKVPAEEAEARKGGGAVVAGKPCVVEMWASWCPPCRNVAPHLSAIARRFRGRGLCVVGVTSEDRGAVAGFVANHKDMDYAVAVDAGGQVQARMAGPAGVRGIPHAFVVDARGRVTYSGHPADPAFERAVEAAVASAGVPDVQKVVQKPPVPGNVVVGSAAEVEAMGVGELKRILTERHVRFEDCREKGELVARALEKCITVRPSAATATPAATEPPGVVCDGDVCWRPEAAKGAGGGATESPGGAESEGGPGADKDVDVDALGVKDLKRMLAARGVPMAGLAEKHELRDALRASLAQGTGVAAS